MADHLIERKTFRYSSNHIAVPEGETYKVVPIKGRASNSYFALINSGTKDLEIAFGSEDDMGDYFAVSPSGYLEPSKGLLSKDQLVFSVKGNSGFTIIR